MGFFIDCSGYVEVHEVRKGSKKVVCFLFFATFRTPQITWYFKWETIRPREIPPVPSDQFQISPVASPEI